MNTILLSIWVKILFITCICIYYNNKILNKYLESSKPVQPSTNALCEYDDIQTIDIGNLNKCKNISGIQTYIYPVGNVNYEISPTEQFYAKVCSGFCIQGLTNTGNCKLPANQQLLEQCETLIQPKSNCQSSSKPLVSVTNNGKKQYYYAVSPINSLNSCS